MAKRTTLWALVAGLSLVGCSDRAQQEPVSQVRLAAGASPVNTLPGPQTTNEDSTLFFSELAGNAIGVADSDNTTLTVEIIVTNGTFTPSTATGLTVTGNGTGDVIITGPTEKITLALCNSRYKPNANYAGPATLTMNTSDSDGGTDLDVLGITVTSFNDPPVNLVPSGAQPATEDAPRVFTSISVSDVDVGNQAVQVSLASTAVTSMTLATRTGLSFTQGDGILDAAMTFTGNLPSVNSALNGLTVTPQANYIGASSLTITSRDLGHTGAGVPGEDSDTIAISWAAVNDPPENSVPPAQGTQEEQALVFSAATGNVLTTSDVDALVSIVQVTLSAANGTITLGNPGALTFASGDGVADTSMTFQATISSVNAAMDGTIFTPNLNFAGTAALTLLTNDMGNSGSGGAKTDTDSVTINVAGINDAPVNTAPAAQTIGEDLALIFSPTNGNAITVADVDAPSLQMTLAATNGTLSLPNKTGLSFTVGSGTADAVMTFAAPVAVLNTALKGLSFVPRQNFNGSGALAITTSDLGAMGSGGTKTDSDTIAITITPVNDPPTAVDDAATTSEDSTAIAVHVLSNDSSAPDGSETLSVTNVTDPAHGSSSINGAAVYYTPDPDFFGTDTIYYTLSDGSLNSTGVLTVTVTPVNDPPTANNDSYTVVQDSANNLFTVLTNDSFAPDRGELLTITHVGTPAHGAATIKAGGINYTPTPGYVGSDTFTYAISDGSGGAASATVTVDIKNAVLPPTNFLPSTQIITEGSPLVFSVANNNTISVSDPDSTSLTVLINVTNGTFALGSASGLSVSGNGSASVSAYGSLTNLNIGLRNSRLNPAAYFSGDCKLSIMTSDANSGVDTDQLTVVVTPVNNPPVNTVPSGVQSCSEDQARTFGGISVNDVDVGDGELLVTLTANNGTNITLGGSVGLGFTAGDGVNDTTMTLKGSLPNVNAALNGLTVTPPPNFLGLSTLTMSTNDQGASGAGVIGEDTDVVTLNWASVNDPPVNSVPASGTLTEDSSFTFHSSTGTGISVSDVDVGGALVRVTLTSTNGTITLGTPSSVSFTSGDGVADATMMFEGTVTNVNNAIQGSVFRPTANFVGNATVTVLTSDLGNTGAGGIKTDSDQVVLTVTAVNDPPLIAIPSSQTTVEDTSRALSAALGNAVSISDPDATSVQVTLSASNGVLSLAAVAGLAFNAGDGTADSSMTFFGTLGAINTALNGMTFMPTANFNGVAGVTIFANDMGATGVGGAMTDMRTVVINVTPANDPPNAVDDTLTVPEDEPPTTVSALANDSSAPDIGETLTITHVGSPSHGRVFLNAGILTYQPDADYNGPDSFAYTVSDGNGGTDIGTVSVTVTTVNDLPVAVDDQVSMPKNTTADANVLANDSTAPDTGETLLITAVTVPAHGSAMITGGGTGLSYTPTLNFYGTDEFAYTVSDGNGGTATATVHVTVNDVDSMPQAVADTLTLDEDSSATIAILANDTGLNDTPLSVSISAPPAAGTAVLQADNTVVYTPAPQYAGVDQFEYAVADADGDNSSATVTITVTAVNDVPVAKDDTVSVQEDTESNIDVLANDESMVELPLELRIETPPEHGTATIEPDSTITYKPNANYFGDDAFVYGVTDGNGDDVTANVAVSVAAVNDMPVAVDDNASTARDESVEIAVLANDTDVEGDTLAVVSASSPEHGSASIGSAGQIAYTPDTSFEGSDEFQYTVEDSAGAQATATVRVEVGKDTDGDGLCDIHEATLGTDPNNPDTDNDGLADGVEVHSASTNPLDDDTDDDGLLDGNEDAQGTSPLEVDSDGDGLQDGTELGLTQPQGKDTDSGVFVADTDDLSTTDPRDDDTDDDGLTDGTEDENHNGKVDAKETDPSSSDSDRDGILDGTEAGRREPEGSGTDQDVFVPDADPETTTNPVVPDTDQGGKLDGEEDSNHNGRVDPGETDPSDPADDLDPNEFFAGAAPRDEGGCGCRVEAQSYRASIVAALVALAGLMVIRRRRGRASATRG